MRLLELILALTVAACGIRLAGLGRAAGMQWIHGMQLLLAAVWVAQVLVEGWRWQMFPAYTAALVVAGTPSLLGLSAQTLFWSTTASVGLVAVSVMSCLLLPFVEPQPAHGAFAVGVTTIAVSVSRPPDVGADELKAAPLVRLWYPAEAPGRWPGFPTLVKQRIAARLRAMPTAPAAPDAPVARNAAKFPVIVYFDGWPEDKIQNIALILELASRGFAVAAVQYPVKLPGTSDASDAQMRAQLAREMVEYSSDAAFERSVQLNHSRARAHARDAIAVLDALTKTGNPVAQRLDTQRAGTLGFSFGGAIAAEASRLDPRIKAAINMDGRHWGDALDQGVERPYMFICEELAMPTAADLSSANPMIRYEAQLDQADYSQLAANLQARGGVRVTIAGMAHMNFTDFPLRSALRRLSAGGTIDARRAQGIIQTYVIEFFSRYLAGAQPPAPDSPWPQFPQVRVQSWPAPKAAAAL
jgi:dienelactone hydrolase